MEYEHQVEYEPFDYCNRGVWTTEALRAHANDLTWDREAALNERVASFIGRQLAHVDFELRYRAVEAPIESNV